MIYGITGYMRSGTSALAKACEKGGMRVAKSEFRDSWARTMGDEQYSVNKYGLFELLSVEFHNPKFGETYDGMVVKALTPFVSSLPQHEYSLAFMRRDPVEIRESYEGAFNWKESVDQIKASIDRAETAIAHRTDIVSVVDIQFTEVLANPREQLARLGWPMDIDAASLAVERELYHFKRNELTVLLAPKAPEAFRCACSEEGI